MGVEAINPGSGFEEIPHTADWAMRAWAADLPALFVASAHGMRNLAGMQLTDGPRLTRTFEMEAPDPESLLVAFLSELVYAAEKERLAFDNFDVQMFKNQISIKMSGAPIASLDKAIKAVTFHNLQIQQTRRGVEVEIVFDV